jgi:hypothetical protein
MVHQIDDIEHGKKAESSRSSSSIQQSINSLPDILNPALSIVLVLVVSFTLEVRSDAIHAQNLLNLLSNLSLDIVTMESISGTFFANKMLKCVIHVMFQSHSRIAKSELSVLATVDLDHCSTSMTKNAIIVSGNIREESIRCNSFMQARNICDRKVTLEVMTQWQANRSTQPLCCILKGLKVDPSKKGSHGLIVGVMAVHRRFMGMQRTKMSPSGVTMR